MNDIIEMAKGAIAKAMAFRFPKYSLRFEEVGEETNMLGVGVFAVPPSDFVAVQDYLFDLEVSGVLPEGWELLPLVRDPVATRTYYPDMLVPGSSVATLCNISSYFTETTRHVPPVNRSPLSIEDFLRSMELIPTEWKGEPTTFDRDHEQKTPRQDLARAA
jgi:hypothetical protein